MSYCMLMTVLRSETIEGLRDKFLNWKEAFENKGLKVNLGKSQVMVSSGITKDGMSKSKVDPCWVCGSVQFCEYNAVSASTVDVH